MKKSINLKSNTLCVCVLALILVCVLVFRNINEGFITKVKSDSFIKGKPRGSFTKGQFIKGNPKVSKHGSCNSLKSTLKMKINKFNNNLNKWNEMLKQSQSMPSSKDKNNLTKKMNLMVDHLSRRHTELEQIVNELTQLKCHNFPKKLPRLPKKM
tara:strand:- start:354 stop:818 length:465 start_codon:yes stop_codon:yes gene_type:complete